MSLFEGFEAVATSYFSRGALALSLVERWKGCGGAPLQLIHTLHRNRVMKDRMKISFRWELAAGAVAFLSSVIGPASGQAIPPSGLKLGATVFPVVGGLRVQATTPGYPAANLFVPGDILTRGSDGVFVYPLLTSADIENFKSHVGPGRWGTVEIYRPSVGTFYSWVTFTPVGGTEAFHADFKPEEEKPGAKKAFDHSKPKGTK
jgi:hypothetical protein